MFAFSSHTDLTLLKEYVEEISGIVIVESKKYLIDSRLTPTMLHLHCQSYSDLIALAKNDVGIQQRIVEAIATYDTRFFRDAEFFNLLNRVVVPKLAHTRKSISVWSSGCSTGQEVYSLFMSLHPICETLSTSLSIHATDISQNAIERAEMGLYSPLEITTEVPDAIKERYFNCEPEGYIFDSQFRSHITFDTVNLLNNVKLPQKYDIIVCRNVLVYFSSDNKRIVLERLYANLEEGGVLILGYGELLEETSLFSTQRAGSSIYYKKLAGELHEQRAGTDH